MVTRSNDGSYVSPWVGPQTKTERAGYTTAAISYAATGARARGTDLDTC